MRRMVMARWHRAEVEKSSLRHAKEDAKKSEGGGRRGQPY